MLLAIVKLKEVAPKNVRPFDFIGFVLFGGSLSVLCFSLAELSESDFQSRPVIFQIIIAVLMMVIYVMRARVHPHPIIRLSLFRVRTFRVSVVGNLVSRLGFGGMPFLLPLFQQIGLGYRAQFSGLLLVPMALGVIFSKLVAPTVLRKLGYRWYLFFNTIIVSVILALYMTITTHTPAYGIAMLTFLFGVFISTQYTGMNSLALAEISSEDLSTSTSITSTNQILAQSFGVAVVAILLRIFSVHENAQTVLTLSDFHHVFLSLSIMTIISTVIFLRLKSGDGQAMLSR